MLSAKTSDILGFCVFVVLGLLLAGWIVAKMRRSPFNLTQSMLFATVYFVCRIQWRARIHGEFPISPHQGAVIICNHRCPLDPSFIALAIPRVVHWMVAREYCEHWLLGWFLRTCEVIPVGRGGIDTTATKMAIRFATKGELVGLFPEGRINTTNEILLPGRQGAALIALKAGVPVVPCFIHGSPYDGTTLGCLRMLASVQLTIGPAIDLSVYAGQERNRKILDHLTRHFLGEIARLGGEPDFQPQLAGRFYKPME
jgi:1-acyl-sn-glycerol-3-phosphate acyltransferase